MITKGSRVMSIGARFSGRVGTVKRSLCGLLFVHFDRGNVVPMWRDDLALVTREPART